MILYMIILAIALAILVVEVIRIAVETQNPYYFILIIAIALIGGTIMKGLSKDGEAYKAGQVHILSGKPAEFKLVEHDDKTTTWEKITNNQGE